MISVHGAWKSERRDASHQLGCVSVGGKDNDVEVVATNAASYDDARAEALRVASLYNSPPTTSYRRCF
jgi:hypothetical protein